MVVATAPAPMCTTDGEGRVRAWNPACEAVLGRPSHEAVGTSLAEAMRADPAVVGPLVARAASGAAVRDAVVEVGAGTADGPGRLSLTLSPVVDALGVVTRLVGAFAVTRGDEGTPTVLRGSEERLRTMLQNINDTITVLDATGRTIGGTGSVTPILGYSVGFWEDRDIFDLLHPEDVAKATALFRDVSREPGNRATSELRIRDAHGNWQFIEGTGVNLLDDPEVGGILVTTRNVTEQTRNRQLVLAQGDILRQVARGENHHPTLIAIAELVEDQLGSGTCAVVVREPDDPSPVAFAPGAETPCALVAELPAALHPGWLGEGSRDADTTLVARSTSDPSLGTLGAELAAAGWRSCWSRPVVSSATNHQHGAIVCLFRTDHLPTPWEHEVAATAADLVAITLEREWSHRRLAELAFYDEVTGLANRLLLANRLEQALLRAKRHGTRVALMFLDLDRFKIINDTLGHESGDQVLREFGQRLRRSVRPEDTVARFGGDEFVVLVEGVHGEDEVDLIAQRLEHSLDEPFMVGDGLYVTASVGVVVSDDTGSAATLLRDADTAMYRAKERGRNRLEVFDEDVRSQLVARMRLESELRRALDRGELEAAYLPTVELASGEVVEVEAIVRWRHPDRGLLEASEFLDVAEESGLSVPLGAWLLGQAVADVAASGTGLSLTVALSPRQLARTDLAARVDEVLERHGWPPGRLVIALAEHLGADAQAARSTLARLAERGVALAIDDFGTGRSSVSLLGGPPGVARVRITGAFLSQMLGSAQTEPLVRAIVDVAHSLDMAVLADGVASADQVSVLRSIACELGQGPAFSAPVSAAELPGLRRA